MKTVLDCAEVLLKQFGFTINIYQFVSGSKRLMLFWQVYCIVAYSDYNLKMTFMKIYYVSNTCKVLDKQ